ncbi:MAG: tripartite tricarboxylate transporter substrate binding protein [Betaproteobacteria bacterium]|nr:tripartite tricarboxylate transporter substrate binding protein [Betaproteobacteria bacterium]
MRDARFLTASLFALLALDAAAQTYPHKPIRIIVPYPPGGPSDMQARLVGIELTKAWGQTSVIDNRGGGSGIIGTELAARADADGHTLILMSATNAVQPALYPKLPYGLARDFAFITQITAGPGIVVVNPSLPIRSVSELIAYAKARPGKVLFGSAGNGAPSHLAVELLKVMAQIDVVHVPYKGMAPALTDVLGGQLQFSIPTIAGGLPLSRAGKLRALAVTGAKRSPAEPDLPTVAEAGVPGYQASNWYGMAAPAKTPRVLVVKLNQEFTRIMAVPELRDKLLNVGMEPTTTTPEQFTEYVKLEVVKWAKVVKSAGIKAD